MPGLLQCLKGKDLGHSSIVAEFWGIEIDVSDVRTAQNDLIKKLIDPALLDEVIAALPGDAKAALDDLIKMGGKLPWDQFTRQYGELREMGPARRDREEPFLNKNASPVEALWYRALIGRAFLASASGPREFTYIPDEFIHLLGEQNSKFLPAPGTIADPQDYVYQFPATDWILDDACTLLAGLRMGLSPELIQLAMWSCVSESKKSGLIYETQVSLLTSVGLIGSDKKPEIEAARIFLEARRGQSLLFLFENWRISSVFNDLKQVPGLHFEGSWKKLP